MGPAKITDQPAEREDPSPQPRAVPAGFRPTWFRPAIRRIETPMEVTMYAGRRGSRVVKA